LYNTDRILTVSEYLQKEIKKIVPRKEITKIELGIDADTVNFIKEDVIITVGNAIDNIYKLKGLDTFAKSSLSFPDHNFIIIGNYDEKIRKEILQINPQITFTGKLEQKQVFEWLQKAKVYCQLSFVESFGVALLEAMSFGCVPVVTLRGAMPEIVGETGFYTEFGDVKILEAGCGLGGWVIYLKERGYDILGLEYETFIIERSKQYDPEIPIIKGDINALDFPNDYFDSYISLGVIEHFEEGPQKALSEAYRVLKPNGLAFITVPYLTVLRKLIAHPLREIYST
ncbi:MAG: hypothetical protein B1H05_03480, partial [Candidatus Cloacimonas sp. 4484_140]